jgi:protein-disulfide isomerase
VLFTDYQCEGCRHIDEQVRALRTRRFEVAISIKHFPLCSDCNRHLKRSNPHPNACWAARAAEAAGILHGVEGFWRMHGWLQETEGTFTDRDLEKGLADLGFGAKTFRETMTDLTTFVRVQADAAEGRRLGIESTPAIFLNGIRLDGTFAERAVVRAVDAVLAKNPPPGTASDDFPQQPARAEVDAVAHVAGTSISRIELEQAVRAEGLAPAEADHDILCKLLDRMASERMLAVAAANRGLTVEQLNRKEVNDKVPEPTSREVDRYAAEVWGYRDGIPRQDIRSKLSLLLRRQRRSERAGRYFHELAAAYGYRITLVPSRVEISVPMDAPSRGPRNAPITLVEFADFACAYCRRNHRSVVRLLEEYGDRVRYVFLDFPLDRHKRALPASLAARAAGEQGRYWDYFDHLMSVSGDLGEKDLLNRAAALGLDIERFTAYDRSAHRAAIDASLALGKRLGVKATPTLFINGRRLVGTRSFLDLESILEEELRSATRLDQRQRSF